MQNNYEINYENGQNNQENKNSEGNKNFEESSNEKIENKMYVHIVGEVINPGVIEITVEDRIKDVIEKAGGCTQEADISKVNLAYKVSDGQKINIPNKNQIEKNEEYIVTEITENIIQDNLENNKNIKININTATQEQLESLNGIGSSTALKIIEYRNKNGKYKNIEEIKKVNGIGESKFEKIKDNIQV